MTTTITTNQTALPTDTHRIEWIDFINSTSSFEHFLTITFNYGTTRRDCFQSGNLLIHRLNQYIFGRRYKKTNQHLAGFAFTELQKSNQPHFHILIARDPLYTLKGKPSFELHLTRQLYRFHYNYFALNRTNRNSLHLSNVVLKPIYDQRNLISYCTKTMYLNNNSNFISPLGPDGMTSI